MRTDIVFEKGLYKVRRRVNRNGICVYSVEDEVDCVAEFDCRREAEAMACGLNNVRGDRHRYENAL